MTNQTLTHPLEGLSVSRWFGSREDLSLALREFINRGALVCISPVRRSRCDRPANGVFWQDACEWYPCCGDHWPEQEMWKGHTRFHAGRIEIQCLAERVDQAALKRNGWACVSYDRETAT